MKNRHGTKKKELKWHPVRNAGGMSNLNMLLRDLPHNPHVTYTKLEI